MKNFFLFILFALSQVLVFSQNRITGKVTTVNSVALEDASVYINNSTIGTTTNSVGEFSISAPSGTFTVIVSYIGFATLQFIVNTDTFNSKLVFKLKEDANLLDEVIIYNTKYNTEWKYNLQQFIESFIGTTEIAQNCEILNSRALHFIVDKNEMVLTAIAKEPLQIQNNDLGYLITFDLVSFTKTKNRVSYLGFSKFELLDGSKRKQRKWRKNRLKTYKGSAIHFAKSLLNNTFKAEGYLVHQFKRILNPDRPSDEKIKVAMELIKLNADAIDLSKITENPITALDSALIISRKSRLPKYKNTLYKLNISLDEIVTKKDGITYLTFENGLNIVYTKEKEEYRYFKQKSEDINGYRGPQTSSILKIDGNPFIDQTGTIIELLDVFYEGYWSYEKFANTLPLDYKPNL